MFYFCLNRQRNIFSLSNGLQIYTKISSNDILDKEKRHHYIHVNVICGGKITAHPFYSFMNNKENPFYKNQAFACHRGVRPSALVPYA